VWKYFSGDGDINYLAIIFLKNYPKKFENSKILKNFKKLKKFEKFRKISKNFKKFQKILKILKNFHNFYKFSATFQTNHSVAVRYFPHCLLLMKM
jgi:uncharacterized protein YjgD (DUF1641 family)